MQQFDAHQLKRIEAACSHCGATEVVRYGKTDLAGCPFVEYRCVECDARRHPDVQATDEQLVTDGGAQATQIADFGDDDPTVSAEPLIARVQQTLDANLDDADDLLLVARDKGDPDSEVVIFAGETGYDNSQILDALKSGLFVASSDGLANIVRVSRGGR